MHRRIEASALLYAVTVALLLGMVLGSLVLLIHLRQIRTERWLAHERLASNARSASHMAAWQSEHEAAFEVRTDLFGEGADSVALVTQHWGLLELIRAHAWQGDQFAQVLSYGGRHFQDRVILELPRTAGTLHVCGDARLNGDVRVPQGDMRRGHIEGRPFTGERLVEGNIYRSEAQARRLRGVVEERLEPLCSGMPTTMEAERAIDKTDLPGPAWDGTGGIPTLEFHGPTHLAGYNLKGPLVIRCDDSLSIGRDNDLDMVLVQAPIISIDSFAMFNAQLFASKRIVVGRGVVLEFPSLLAVWRDPHDAQGARISIGPEAILQGAMVVVDRGIRGRPSGSLEIAPSAVIHGEVYAEGMIQLQGSVQGTVTAAGFSLRTAASIYQGHLMDGVISRWSLGDPVGFGVIDGPVQPAILRWGRMLHG